MALAPPALMPNLIRRPLILLFEEPRIVGLPLAGMPSRLWREERVGFGGRPHNLREYVRRVTRCQLRLFPA